MNLTADHRSLLATLSEASARYTEARTTAHAKARREADAQIEAARKIRDRLAAEAHAAGIPVLRISEDGLHTQNRKTAREAIAAGSMEGSGA